MVGAERCGDLQRVGFGSEPLLALLAFMERVDLRHCALGALAQALCLPAGVGQRPHAPTSCLPSQCSAFLALAALLADGGKTHGSRLGLVIGLAFGTETNVGQRRRATPDRCQQPSKVLR